MKAALDLTSIAASGWDFVLIMIVERIRGGKMLEGLALAVTHAVLKRPPMLVAGNLMLVEVKFGDEMKLSRGKIKDHWMPSIPSAEAI